MGGFWMSPLGREKAKPHDIILLFGTQASVGHCRQIHCLPGLTGSVNGYETITTVSGTAEISNALISLDFLIQRVKARKYFWSISMTEERRACVYVS